MEEKPVEVFRKLKKYLIQKREWEGVEMTYIYIGKNSKW